MKRVIIAAILFFVCSCRKDVRMAAVSGDGYLRSVLGHLRDSIGVEGFSLLDTDRVYSGGPNVLRIGYRGKAIASEFLLVRTDSAGNVLRGRVVRLNLSALSGSIETRSFAGAVVMSSGIENGVITALHARQGVSRTIVEGRVVTTLPAPDADWLPEVVVVGYGGGSAGTPYMAFDGVVGNSSGGILAGGSPGGGAGSASGGTGAGSGSGGSSGVSDVVGGSGGSGSSGGSGGGSGSGGTTVYSPVVPTGVGIGRQGVLGGGEIELEGEYIYSIPTVDVRKLFNCFDLVPDEGATYSIQLCVDLPVNSVPDMSMNFSGGVNAGHAFLVVTKNGSGTSITQAFGFYPQTAPTAWNPFLSIPSVIKDNGDKEINAVISMALNSDQYKSIKSAAINFSSRPYLLDKSNCTDYALSVFNAGRTTPITMDPYVLSQSGIVMPNGMSSPPITVSINNSPQKLYEKLANMKSSGDMEGSSIQLDLSHSLHSPISHGMCN